jgi:hypothetical protein
MMWLGIFEKATASLPIMIAVRNASGVLTQPDGDVTLRSWDDGGLDLTETADPLVSLTVDGATNASPIVVTTTTAHGLQTGMRVTISDVGGNTAANGTFVITKVSDTTFSLNGSTGDGAYTSGGTAVRTGIYAKEIAGTDLDATARTITATFAVAGVDRVEHFRFLLI